MEVSYSILYYRNIQNIVILISGPSLLYVFKKWSEFTLKVVRVYLKSGPSLPGPSLPGPSLLVLFIMYRIIPFKHTQVTHTLNSCLILLLKTISITLRMITSIEVSSH